MASLLRIFKFPRSDLGPYTICPVFLIFLITTGKCLDSVVKEVMISSLRIPSS
jgi:hypothetical protein